MTELQVIKEKRDIINSLWDAIEEHKDAESILRLFHTEVYDVLADVLTITAMKVPKYKLSSLSMLEYLQNMYSTPEDKMLNQIIPLLLAIKGRINFYMNILIGYYERRY